jgi:hypothetical protein
MEPSTFLKLAHAAGFSHDQANFLLEHVAQKPHTHLATEVIVDPEDSETLEHFIDELVATEVFEDGPVLHGEEGDEGEEEEAS